MPPPGWNFSLTNGLVHQTFKTNFHNYKQINMKSALDIHVPEGINPLKGPDLDTKKHFYPPIANSLRTANLQYVVLSNSLKGTYYVFSFFPYFNSVI